MLKYESLSVNLLNSQIRIPVGYSHISQKRTKIQKSEFRSQNGLEELAKCSQFGGSLGKPTLLAFAQEPNQTLKLVQDTTKIARFYR